MVRSSPSGPDTEDNGRSADRADSLLLTDGGGTGSGADDGESVGDDSTESDAETVDDIVEKDGVSRRGMLFYGGGSALVTLGGFGAGWFAFIRESYGPEEELVRDYVDAIDRGRFYSAQEMYHENAPGEAWGQEELPGVDRISLSVEETDVADRVDQPDLEGVEELALVHVDITMEGSANSELLKLAFEVAENDDGEWKLWRDQ